jgi:hypothetical protein
MTIFDMASEVADAGVEDIAKRVLSKEEIAEYSHTTGIFVV